jgi:hypothetical protein
LFNTFYQTLLMLSPKTELHFTIYSQDTLSVSYQTFTTDLVIVLI